jgi:hypothetical protein
MPHTRTHHLSGCILALALGVWLLPAPAWAWGPAAHLDFGLTALEHLALLAPAVAALLRRYSDDFLYGSLAADITIGKNLSPWHLHCHNWQVGFAVLDRAEREDTQAFAWGYLAHLAADSVAHNYFVPYKLVESYPRRGAGHTYWEVRFDTRVSHEAWTLAKRLSTRAHPEHDQHLRALLRGPLFSFAVQKQIFTGFVAFTRLLRERHLAEALDRRSQRQLSDEEVAETNGLCVARVIDLLAHGRTAACVQADPTGLRNLRIAGEVRDRLRDLASRGRLVDPHGAAARFRPLFRAAIDHKLSLPSMLELVTPDPAAPRAPPPRGLLDGRAARTRAERRARRQRRQTERQGRRAAQAVARAAYASVERSEGEARRDARRRAREVRRAAVRAEREARRGLRDAAQAEQRAEQEAWTVAEAAYRAVRKATRAAAAGERIGRPRFSRARALARTVLAAMRLARRRPGD